MLKINISKIINNRLIRLNIDQMLPEIIALVGRSGIGKTTLLNIIAGLDDAKQLEVTLNNEVLSEKTHLISTQNRKIGYLFQDYQLFPHMTVFENIHYITNHNAFTQKLIEHLNIAHCLNQYPSTLSGGEAQRVALCRVLSVKPNLLLLDEPFSSLDDETQEEGIALIQFIYETWSIPIIIVTHSKKEVTALAHKIIEIK